jgi:hypothetical protein
MYPNAEFVCVEASSTPEPSRSAIQNSWHHLHKCTSKFLHNRSMNVFRPATQSFKCPVTLAAVLSTVELHFSGLTGTASHPDIEKFRIIGFFFENMLHWQFEVAKKFLHTCFSLHIHLCTNRTLIHNSLYVFDIWGKI